MPSNDAIYQMGEPFLLLDMGLLIFMLMYSPLPIFTIQRNVLPSCVATGLPFSSANKQASHLFHKQLPRMRRCLRVSGSCQVLQVSGPLLPRTGLRMADLWSVPSFKMWPTSDVGCHEM